MKAHTHGLYTYVSIHASMRTHTHIYIYICICTRTFVCASVRHPSTWARAFYGKAAASSTAQKKTYFS